jgi:hypothetical protein
MLLEINIIISCNYKFIGQFNSSLYLVEKIGRSLEITQNEAQKDKAGKYDQVGDRRRD